MNNPSIRQLAAGAISRSDGVSVELHHSGDSPAVVVILWPPKSTKIPPTPQAIADLGRAIVRTLGAAQTELTRLHRKNDQG
jgi:hypothetical protein